MDYCWHMQKTQPELHNQMVTSDYIMKAKCQLSDRYRGLILLAGEYR